MALPRSERREVLDRGSARFWTDRGSGQSRISHGAKFWTIEPAVECSHVFEQTEQRKSGDMNQPIRRLVREVLDREVLDSQESRRDLSGARFWTEVLDSQESPSEQREVLDEVLDTQPRFWTEPRFWTVKNLQRREVLDQEPARLNE